MRDSILYAALVTLALAMFLGCASPYKDTCSFPMTFTLTHGDEADKICRPRSDGRWDNGLRIWPDQKIAGCATYAPAEIVSPNDCEVICHEARHMFDKFCRKEVDVKQGGNP